MTRVLLVDDDLDLREMLGEYLSAEGFEIDTAHDGKSGVEKVRANGHDAVVLDVMLPLLDGFGALRRIRNGSAVPVIMLTAKGEDVDRIVGLEIGADDYLAKPWNPRELAARLRAVLRRTQGSCASSAQDTTDQVTVGALEISPAARTATWSRKPFTLTSTEFNLLLLLARSAGHVVSKGPRTRLMVSTLAAVLARSGTDAADDLLMDDPNERRPDVLVVDAEGKDLLNRVVPEAAYKTAREAAPDEISREVTTPDGRTYLLFSPADDHEMEEHRHRRFPPMPGDALDEEQTLDRENRPPPPLPKHSRFGPYDTRLLVALLASILCGRRLHC